MSIFSELKRRNVIRVAAAYVVSSWVLVQAADTILPLFGFSDDAARIVVVVLAIGFIPALVISWAFELTPDGWRRESGFDHADQVSAGNTRRFDRVVIVILAIGITYFAIDKFVLTQSVSPVDGGTIDDARVAEATREFAANTSIAILPFRDISPGQDRQLFADKISEDILNILTRLDGLNVIGRSSSFRFRGENSDLRSIGQQLEVPYILEGGIHVEDDQIEVTARLVDTRNETVVMPYARDGNLSGIFDVQKEIATEVAGALQIVLTNEDRSFLPGTSTTNLDAYMMFIEANATLRGGGRFDLVSAMFDRAMELDPNFAEALAAKGMMLGFRSYSMTGEDARAAQDMDGTLFCVPLSWIRHMPGPTSCSAVSSAPAATGSRRPNITKDMSNSRRQISLLD